MNTTDVFPSRAFEIDDGAELYVLPNFPIDKWNLIQDAILDRFLDLNELAGNAISDNPSSEEITPSYMTTFCNLKSVVEMELREREEETVHVRLGKIAPRIRHTYEDSTFFVKWCNPLEGATSLEEHRWVGRVIYSVLKAVSLQNGGVKEALKQTSCVLASGWEGVDKEINEFRVKHVPSSLSNQLKSFLESINSENILEKLNELSNDWISVPNPNAIIECGLSTVQDWYDGVPSLGVRDFRDDDRMDSWVTVLFGIENSSKGWMNLDVSLKDKPVSFSKLKDNPCNSFLCSHSETKFLRRFLTHEKDKPWNFFSSDVAVVSQYMADVLSDEYSDNDKVIEFNGLLSDGSNDVPIIMHKWHAVLMCGWLMAWSP